jgi:hypothetical protein
MGLVTVGIALVVAARWGMLPFHLRVSRLADLVPPETLPLLLAWGAVPMTVVSLAAVDRLVAPLALPLDGERAVLVALAFATLVGAALAAFVHDDLRHATAYLVIADAGLLLLAIAALDPHAWGPARAWLIALAASKTALLAWGAVTEDRFSTRSIPDLRGWIRRSPLLAAALVVAAVATFGLPGWVALDARLGLADAAAGSPWRELLVLAGFLTLPTYLRLLGTGVGRATSRVEGAAPERIARRRRPRELLPVEQERIAAAEPAGASAPARAATTTPEVTSADAEPGSLTTVARRRAPRPRGVPGLPWRGPTTARSLQEILVRDRAELLSATVLALAILAALTSWGALDLAGAAAEPAPILLTGAGD